MNPRQPHDQAIQSSPSMASCLCSKPVSKNVLLSRLDEGHNDTLSSVVLPSANLKTVIAARTAGSSSAFVTHLKQHKPTIQ